ncbi:MAG: ABC transporter permease subunit [Proteobacteria bacterium]|nr:ABC transporter permease subunit [Pseudomonadota bacterium]
MSRNSGALVRLLDMPALFGLAAAALLLCCFVPLLVLASELWSAAAFDQLRSTLGAARSWGLLVASIVLGLATTLIAVAFGVPLGVLLARSNMIGRAWALWLHLFPLFLPPFLLALGWFQLFGRGGLLGSSATSALLFGPAGVVVTLALAFTPVVSALTGLGLMGIDPALEEAAQVVSPPLRVVTRILLPLAWPSIAFGALVVFALSLSEVGVPMFLGVRTYSAAVFTRLGGVQYAPGEAVALVLPLFALGLVLVAIDRRLLGRRSYAALSMRSRDAAPLDLGRARVPLSGLAWLAALVPLAPLGSLLAAAGPNGLSEGVSWIRSSLATSLLSGVLAASAVVLIAVLTGHALARQRPFARSFDALALLAFMTPASVLGVGLIGTWNRPQTQLVYTGMGILMLGYVARYAAVGIRTLAAVFSRSSLHYEEAAAAFGAGFARRMLRIVVPMHARGVAAAWLIVLVFCLRDLDTVVTFYPPGLEPLAVRIFTLEANGPRAIVAALGVLHVLLTALAVAGAGLVLRGARLRT